MRRFLVTTFCIALLAAACGKDQSVRETSSSKKLDAVEVKAEEGKKPTLTFDEPFRVTETSTRMLAEGDGKAIETNSTISLDYLLVNGRDGSEVGSSYGEGNQPAQFTYNDSLPAGIRTGLKGVKAGSQVLIAIAPADGAGADEQTGLKKTDTVLFYADVLDVTQPLTRAEGEAVPPVAGLPTVELAKDGAPTITVPKTAPPTELVVQPLIKGSGPKVEKGQSITVHYTGVLWADGKVFDSSWESGNPATFQIGTGAVIPGWDEGLVGQTVGSQILLVVPPEKGYPEGSPDGSIKPTDTLVFVVDILGAS